MPVRAYEPYHGVALLRLIDSFGSAEICVRPDMGAGCYVVDAKIGVFIKYASRRMSPWLFTFQSEHVQSLKALRKACPLEVLVLLVCGNDGLVSLRYHQARFLTTDHGCETWWIRVERTPRKMYAVSGSGGQLDFKVADSDFLGTRE